MSPRTPTIGSSGKRCLEYSSATIGMSIGKPVRAEGGIEDVRDLERPALGRKHGCHSSSPIRSTIRRILSLVAGSMPRYFRKKALSVASSTRTDSMMR